MEKIAEIESTQGYIQMHAVIPEVVTKRLNPSITLFIVAGGPQKQIAVSIAFDCVSLDQLFLKK